MPHFMPRPRGKPGERIPAKDYNKLQADLQAQHAKAMSDTLGEARFGPFSLQDPDKNHGEEPVIHWAKAVENWRQNGGDPIVNCVRCNDRAGTATGAPIVVYLPYLPGTNKHDPNVVVDDVIGYAFDGFARAICVTDYMDARIRTVWLWADAVANIPTGWAEMNGIANRADFGGSGIDMRGQFAIHPDPTGDVTALCAYYSFTVGAGTGSFVGHGLYFIERLDNSEPETSESSLSSSTSSSTTTSQSSSSSS